MTHENHDNDFVPAEQIAHQEEPAAKQPPSKRGGRTAKAVVAGALLVGGTGGAAILAPLVANAASPTPSASTAPSTSGDSGHAGYPGGPGGPGGHTEAVSDTSVVAKAIGITEAQLLTELNAGKTPAQVATAHGVAVQKVIDAVVADGMSELAADVKAGRITQAQADAMKSQVTQRATDQVNNGFRGGPH